MDNNETQAWDRLVRAKVDAEAEQLRLLEISLREELRAYDRERGVEE